MQGRGRSDSCLTAGQVDTAKKIYAGAKFKDGTPIYSGFEPGSELNWNFMIEKEPFSVNINYFKGMVFQDPNWDFRTFDVDRDTRLGIERTGKYVDGNNPDLRPFKKAGGKLIIVSSWNSLALPPRQVTEYYKSVEKVMGGPQQTQDFARLFSVPGAGGCPGFVMNAGDFKALEAMQEWVEKGKAPEQIIYSHREAGGMSAGMGSPGKSIAPGRYAPIPRCRNIREAAISMTPPILPALLRVNSALLRLDAGLLVAERHSPLLEHQVLFGNPADVGASGTACACNKVAPLLYKVEDNRLYLIREDACGA